MIPPARKNGLLVFFFSSVGIGIGVQLAMLDEMRMKRMFSAGEGETETQLGQGALKKMLPTRPRVKNLSGRMKRRGARKQD